MASVKIIHYTHKKYSDGTSPLIIQVIKNSITRKKTFAQIFDYQFDDSSRRVKRHANASTINQRISEEFNRIEQIILSGKDFDIEKIFDEEVNQKEITFWDITDNWLRYIKSKNYGTFVSFESQIVKFKEFVKRPDLLLSDIDEPMLDKYQAYLIRKGNKQSSINSAFKKIRMAAKYGHKPMGEPKNEIVAEYFVKGGKKPNKTKLVSEELQAIKSIPYGEDSKMKEIVDLFMLAVYLRGMRVADVIQIKNEFIIGGRLIYTSNKNLSHFNIKLVPEALEIINKYKSDREYLFSFYKFVWNDTLSDEENERARFFHIKSVTSNINGKLNRIAKKAGIAKKISSHIAKHTFGKMAIDKIKDTNIRMDLMGHSSIEAHETYVRELTKEDDLDNAADQIFGI